MYAATGSILYTLDPNAGTVVDTNMLFNIEENLAAIFVSHDTAQVLYGITEASRDTSIHKINQACSSHGWVVRYIVHHQSCHL